MDKFCISALQSMNIFSMENSSPSYVMKLKQFLHLNRNRQFRKRQGKCKHAGTVSLSDRFCDKLFKELLPDKSREAKQLPVCAVQYDHVCESGIGRELRQQKLQWGVTSRLHSEVRCRAVTFPRSQAALLIRHLTNKLITVSS